MLWRHDPQGVSVGGNDLFLQARDMTKIGYLMHPYLARREGTEPNRYLDDRLKPVLERTLGVPLFQEQMLKIAMVMANFSGAEAEELRRALSFHRSQERMQRVEKKLRAALAANQVSSKVTEEIVAAITSFGLYGFPESHAISFALIAYASAWLKVHRPAEFYVGLLNNQPMVFYSSATLVKDAQRRLLRVLPVSDRPPGDLPATTRYRQRIVFINVEDETGSSNAIVTPPLFGNIGS